MWQNVDFSSALNVCIAFVSVSLVIFVMRAVYVAFTQSSDKSDDDT
jgi:hypothetical protein